jgi:hypothetical protein
MDNLIASGMIPMFLSGLTHGPETEEGLSAAPAPSAPRRLLLACSGTSAELSDAVENMAFAFGRKEAGTTIYRIPENNAQHGSIDLTAYDGVFMGIAPDGSGATNRAFSFIRHHINTLSAMPAALFFLLSRAPKLNQGTGAPLFEGLAPMSPLDVRIFQRSGSNLTPAVTEWARNDIWPLMETGWLADLIFPGPESAMAEPVLSHG